MTREHAPWDGRGWPPADSGGAFATRGRETAPTHVSVPEIRPMAWERGEPPLPGEEGRWRGRPELRDVRGPRRPSEVQTGWQMADRLRGLALVVLGAVGFRLFVFGQSVGPFHPLASHLATPLTMCLVPFAFLGSCGLVLVGLRRLVLP